LISICCTINYIHLFIITIPFTFNDELIVVALFNVVFPKTSNYGLVFAALFNVVFPETFNNELIVVAFLMLLILIYSKLIQM
jgi:hypothetical protein